MKFISSLYKAINVVAGISIIFIELYFLLPSFIALIIDYLGTYISEFKMTYLSNSNALLVLYLSVCYVLPCFNIACGIIILKFKRHPSFILRISCLYMIVNLLSLVIYYIPLFGISVFLHELSVMLKHNVFVIAHMCLCLYLYRQNKLYIQLIE